MATNNMIRNIPGDDNRRKKMVENSEEESEFQQNSPVVNRISDLKITFRQKQKKSGGGVLAKRVFSGVGGILAFLGAASQTGNAAALLDLLK